MRSLPWLCASLLLSCAPAIEPSRLELNRTRLDFGTVEAGVGGFRTVLALRNPGEAAVHVTSLRLDPPAPELELEGLPIDEVAGGSRKLLTVVYRPLVDGTVSSVLRVETDDGLAPREVPIVGAALHLDAVVQLDSGASCPGTPGSLDFGTVTNGTTVSRQLVVESTGTGVIGVVRASVSPADAGFTVEGNARSLPPGTSGTLTVKYDPRIAGPLTGLITLETNSLALPKLEVPLCATGLVSALCVAPALLSFGDVAPGTSAVATVTASSCGNLPVTLTGAEQVQAATTGTGFSLRSDAGLPLTLDAGQSTSFELRFDSTSRVRARTQLRFTSSSLVTPEVLVNAGANLPPPCDARLDVTSLHFYKDLAWAQPLRLTNQGSTDCVIERLEILPLGSPFELDRQLELPAVLPGNGSIELVVKYLPAPTETQPATATLELELDWVHRVSLQGDPLPPPACHLVPGAALVDFGLIDPSVPAARILSLTNVGSAPCRLMGATTNRSELTASLVSTTVEPGGATAVTVSYTPAGAAVPVQGTLTLSSNDADEPQRRIPVSAGHVRCDPDCHCDATQTATYWRFPAQSGGSSITTAAPGQGAIWESCDPRRCSGSQVAVQVGRDAFLCAQPPPTCSGGLALDFVIDGWACVPCALIVQYGGLFGGVRVCAPAPNLSCAAGEAPTFDAARHAWSCQPTCDNGLYDQRIAPGGALVCVPC